jgi:hypothetical protein
MSDLLASVSRIALGIDPGAHGAVVVFHDGRPVDIYDTPALEEKSGRPAKGPDRCQPSR